MSKVSRTLVFLFTILLLFLGAFSAFEIDITEDLNSTLPGNEEFKRITPFLDQGNKTLLLSLTIPDKDNFDSYSLSLQADSLIKRIKENTDGLIDSVYYKSNIDPLNFAQFLIDNIYLYLDEYDYQAIDSLIRKENIEAAFEENKRQLYLAEGIITKNTLRNDPLHLLNLVYKRHFSTINAQELASTNGLFISSDKSKLFFIANLAYDPSESSKNAELASSLSKIQEKWNDDHFISNFDYFGTFLIADANAKQIKKDIMITVTIAMLLILSLLVYYYRSVLILVLFVLPGAFGILFSLLIIYFFQTEISGIALSASAIVFGIVVDYSFHFFSDFRQSKNAYKTRNLIAFPLLLSGSTTILAFLSLTLAQSRVLNDFGLFTSLSLLGALSFVLIVLPELLQLLHKYIQFSQVNKLDKLFESIKIHKAYGNKYVILAIVLLTTFFLFLAGDISFEDDLNKINYHPEELKVKELAHQDINPDEQKRINLIVRSENKDDAALKNYQLYQHLLTDSLNVHLDNVNSLAPILIPESIQNERLLIWNKYWEQNEKEVVKVVMEKADKYGFIEGTFQPFFDLIGKKSGNTDIYKYVSQRQPFSQMLLNDGDNINILTDLVFPREEYQYVINSLSKLDYVDVVDGAGIMTILTNAVKDDFNFLLMAAGLIVLITMLLTYGSVDLTIISFLPMLVSWIWILGLSVLLDFKFNFVNIILATFIFGLGDDFAIFITDGLQNKYKYGREVLTSYKTGIMLSSISTIIGTGVLFFAKHPAINSIAGISVTGIVCIVIVSFFVQPILFRLLITNRIEKGKPPMSLYGIVHSFLGYSFFVSGSLFGVVSSFFIQLIPFYNVEKKKLMVHKVLMRISGIQLDIISTIKRNYYNMDNLNFDKPSILIANHSSFFDILALVRLNPKLVLMVNNWVYNSPIFGRAIRYADYIPAFKPIEETIETAEALIKKGYSIAIFPEGRRSPDGVLRRFHKGAFYLAEQLNLSITPVMLHGYSYVMPKHDYYLKSSHLNMKVLERIEPSDMQYGKGYKERSKSISRHFKSEYSKFKNYCEREDYQLYALAKIYKYKGPVLDNYFRIKWRFEKKNYERYNELIGLSGKKVYDLGCGYGYLSYFLKLRDESRAVIGIDYDEKKVSVANNAYLRQAGIDFFNDDLTDIEIKSADVIILADVLHYMDYDDQLAVLNNCLNGLNSGGMILIREGVKEEKQEHEWTKRSERWSTKWVRFNKTSGDLHFLSSAFIEKWANDNALEFSKERQSQKSSNTLFILKR